MTRSTFGKHLWFLFGERLLIACVLASIAPGAYSIWLFRKSDYWAGLLIGVAWLLFFLLLATTMHRKGIVRLGLSLTAAVAVLLAWTVATIEMG